LPQIGADAQHTTGSGYGRQPDKHAINFAYINPDYKVRLHPDILLAAARAYKEDADNRLEARRKQAMNQ
jgi:hypothetical protein